MNAENLVGKKLGPYEVQTLLGSGGMSHVYRGLDVNLQRAVAIKVLARNVAAQPHVGERFRQEARMVAALHHPHIVQVYHFGQQDENTYMVQELLPGPTLEQYLCDLDVRGRRLSRQDIVSIVAQLASALDVAHAAGIVHRDVKPGNVIWNASGALVLTDFGIASHILTGQHPRQNGGIFGTPYYLSPEQAQGFPASQACDIYALGVVIYEMITGRVPFTGETTEDVINQHINAAPPPLGNLCGDLPPAVEDVIRCAMAKNPADRFGSAGELSRALRRAWPPTHESARRVVTESAAQQETELWRDMTTSISFTAQAKLRRHEHTHTTTISPDQLLNTLLSRSARSPSQRELSQTARMGAARRALSRRRHTGWQTLVQLVGTLLALLIVSSSIIALHDDYQQQASSAPADEPTASSTIVPTARLLLTTAVPDAPLITPLPMLPAATPDSAALVAPTPSTRPDTLAPTTPDEMAPATVAQQFVVLRSLLESESAAGWNRLERMVWLKRLDEIQQAIEAGQTEQAATWLQELRQIVLNQVENGSMPPEVAQQVAANIDRIALSHNIALPPFDLPAGEDG